MGKGTGSLRRRRAAISHGSADQEFQLSKIAVEARTAIEETETNMLFAVFGFLEFYDSDDSDRPLLPTVC